MPFGDYELVLIIDSDQNRWYPSQLSLFKIYHRVIPILAAKFEFNLYRCRIEQFIEKTQKGDDYLERLRTIFKKIAKNKYYRDEILNETHNGLWHWIKVVSYLIL